MFPNQRCITIISTILLSPTWNSPFIKERSYSMALLVCLWTSQICCGARNEECHARSACLRTLLICKEVPYASRLRIAFLPRLITHITHSWLNWVTLCSYYSLARERGKVGVYRTRARVRRRGWTPKQSCIGRNAVRWWSWLANAADANVPLWRPVCIRTTSWLTTTTRDLLAKQLKQSYLHFQTPN